MKRVIFYQGHMAETDGNGLIKIIRFMTDQSHKTFVFRTSLLFDDAIAWAKRWIERVVY